MRLALSMVTATLPVPPSLSRMTPLYVVAVATGVPGVEPSVRTEVPLPVFVTLAPPDAT
jgi:hypothetical protein